MPTCPNADLTPEQTGELRRKAVASQYRRIEGRRVPIRFQGRPLDGIRIAVPEYDATCWHIGFAIVSPRGPVQVLYRHEGEGEGRICDAIEPGWR